MPTVIEQLQVEALNSAIEVSDLLRKTKLVASKLDLIDLERWADAELNGYETGKDVPDYRKVDGRPIWLNPVRGWLPIVFGGGMATTVKKMSAWHIRDSVGELEALAANNKGGGLHVGFSPEVGDAIGRAAWASARLPSC